MLRGGFASVLVGSFDAPEDFEIRRIDLGGLGMRDLARAADRSFLIAGPVTDASGRYFLYSWTGDDGVPGVGATEDVATCLGETPTIGGEKAEGLAVRETVDSFEFVVVFDGVEGGRPTKFSIPK